MRESSADKENAMAQQAYKALLTITLKKPDDEKYTNFSREVKIRAKQEFQFEYGEEEVRYIYIIYTKYNT